MTPELRILRQPDGNLTPYADRHIELSVGEVAIQFPWPLALYAGAQLMAAAREGGPRCAEMVAGGAIEAIDNANAGCTMSEVFTDGGYALARIKQDGEPDVVRLTGQGAVVEMQLDWADAVGAHLIAASQPFLAATIKDHPDPGD